MAFLLSGEAGQNYNCNDCSIDQTRKEVWGCNGKCLMSVPTFFEVVDGIKINYWSCPVKFVPNSIWHFIKVRNYYSNHPSAPFPCFDNVSPRWLAAEQIFNSEINSYLKNRKLK